MGTQNEKLVLAVNEAATGHQAVSDGNMATESPVEQFYEDNELDNQIQFYFKTPIITAQDYIDDVCIFNK